MEIFVECPEKNSDLANYYILIPPLGLSQLGLSDLFSICHCSRQGCLASPSIFILSFEPLAQYICKAHQLPHLKVYITFYFYVHWRHTCLTLFFDRQSLPNELKIIEHFSALAGNKINYSKSILLLLNTDLKKLNIQSRKRIFRYRNPCIQAIARNNYWCILKKVDDLVSAALPSSMPAYVATIKINVLLHINLTSSMIALQTTAGYWKKLDSKLKKVIWNRTKPCIKWSTLQWDKPQGWWACPKFKLYHSVFLIHPLKYWFDTELASPWKMLEQKLAHPEIYVGFKSNWHKHSPICHNTNLLTGDEPFISQLCEHGIRTLGDVSGQNSELSIFPI